MTAREIFIQATAIEMVGCGILLTGVSGAGKSDLALRFIMEKKAMLIGDDGVYLQKKGQQLFLFPHPETKGLLEVRGMGLVRFDAIHDIPLCLHVTLDMNEPERLPHPQKRYRTIADVRIPSVQINPFHVSSMQRVLLALEIAKNDDRLTYL